MDDTTGKALAGYGTLVETLGAEHFPLSKSDLYYIVGDLVLPLQNGAAPVRVLLDSVEADEFRDVDAVLAALHAVADGLREAPIERDADGAPRQDNPSAATSNADGWG